MVTIRSLKPTVKIRRVGAPVVPEWSKAPPRPSQRKQIVRSLKDFPPPTPQPTQCRLWQGAVDKAGYGSFKRYIDGKRYTYKVHRWVVEQSIGRRLKPKEVVLHACDNPPCFRLDHLSVGTIQDNNADMKAKGRNKKPPVNRLMRDRNPNAKLTYKQVVEVRELFLQGYGAKRIAEHYGVHVTTILRITKDLGNRDQRYHQTDYTKKEANLDG